MKDDTISRAAALDALGEEPPVWYDGEDEIAERNQWRRDVAAIKALPSATDINVGGNLIDRRAALDALNAMKICRPLDSDRYVISDCMNKIAALSSVQPERKKGKWIERNPRNSPDCRLIECSECGNAYIVGYNINYDDWIDGRNFCMKCGADLRGGSNVKNT